MSGARAGTSTAARSLIVGSTGQLARAFLDALRDRGESPLQTSSSGAASLVLDLSRPETISELFSHLAAAFPGERFEVFLCGAMTHVDRCEEERERCLQMNELSPGLIAEQCAKHGHKLTYFSTEYVFGEAEYHGGAKGPFSEKDPPAPTSWYGHCKLGGEQRVLAALPDALVVRTTMVFSWDPGGNNVLMQYHNQLRDIRDGKSPPVFRVPEDQISTPTYAPFLAQATLKLREKGRSGIYNVVGSTLLSRRQLVSAVIEEFGFDPEESLRGFRFLKTAELGQKAKRPLTAGLTMDKAVADGIEPWSLERAFMHVRALREG